jgi:SAM-dependent methyltransferase
MGSEALLKPPEPPPDEIYRIVLHAQAFYVLDAALELDLFERLKTPKTAAELAGELGTDPALTEAVCDALAALGLLKKRGGAYENSALASAYLTEGSPYCMKNLLRLMRSSLRDRWPRLLDALRGKPVGAGGRDPRLFTLAVAESALAGGLHGVVEVLREIEDLKRARRLLDLGGGHGLYSVALVKLFPQLHAYVLDLPEVLEVAREIVSRYGGDVIDRVHFVPADFTRDDIGSGYDVVLASHSLYGYRERLAEILRKVHAALNGGGLFISNHAHKSQGLRASLFELQIAMARRGFSLFSVGELMSRLREAGFVVEDVAVVGGAWPSTIVVARKPLQ